MGSGLTENRLLRSTLYRLQPMGSGTPYVECLSSYINRLAFAHRLTPGDLLAEVISPVINKKYITNGSKKSHDPFYTDSYKINGDKQEALDFVIALEKLTGWGNLKHLTTGMFGALPSKGLLRRYQAWCPVCYCEWAGDNMPIYSPLLWQVKVVETCIHHDILLKSHCPACGKTVSHLAYRGPNGFCPICRQWLGDPDYSCKVGGTTEYQRWVSQEIGRLLEHVQNEPYSCTQDNIRFNVPSLVEAAKGIPGFRESIGVSKSTIHGWRYGKNVPTLELLARICFLIGLSIGDVLFGRIAPEGFNSAQRSLPVRIKEPRISVRPDYQRLKHSLDECIITKTGNSLEAVAAKLSVSSKTLRKRFPEECRRISEGYLEDRKTKTEARMDALRETTEAIISGLRDENLFPTRDLVEKRLGIPFALKNKELHDIWIKAKAGYFSEAD